MDFYKQDIVFLLMASMKMKTNFMISTEMEIFILDCQT